MALWIRIKAHVSRADAAGLLAFLTEFGWQLASLGGSSPSLQSGAIQAIPAGMESVDASFNVTGRTITYAICPRCHCTYAPSDALESGRYRYPTHCDYSSPAFGPPCGESLVDIDGEPFKSYLYHCFHDHVGSLLSRADLREQFRRFRSDACRPAPSQMTDIRDGEFVRILKGRDGKPFMEIGQRSEGSPEEFRLLWSLNVDGFQVEGANIHGVSRSATIMTMACLSVDGDTRFGADIVYLSSVIPGEPGVNHLHHYLRPLVDQLYESWSDGVRFTYTDVDTKLRDDLSVPSHRTTFDSRSAVAAIVCDSPAGRTLMGFNTIKSHHFCFIHNNPNLRFLGNTDFENWVPLENDILRNASSRWMNESSHAERKKIKLLYGAQYSEMWRLPYLDAPLQLIIDAMHGLARVGQEHAIVALQLFEHKKSALTPGTVACYSYAFELPPRPVARDQPNDQGEQNDDDVVDESQPNFDGVDLDVDVAYDPDISFGGAPSEYREPVDEATQEGRDRMRQLHELRGVMPANDCIHVLRIHRRLTIPLGDGLKPHKKNNTNETPRSPVQWLKDGLAANNLNALRFVAIDLGLSITPSNMGKSPLKTDYAHALAEWVRSFSFATCSDGV